MEEKQLIPGDGAGWGKRGEVWNRGRRLEARVTSLEARVITLTGRIEQPDEGPAGDVDVLNLINAVKDLPGNPLGVRLSDQRRAQLAAALEPFGGATRYQAPHIPPQEKAA